MGRALRECDDVAGVEPYGRLTDQPAPAAAIDHDVILDDMLRPRQHG